MKGLYLKFYTQENRRHDHRLVYEWLVATARELHLPGCSVFHAIGGYGHHGRLHSQHFFELQGDLPVEVGFALSEAQAKALLAKLREAKVELFWVSLPAEFGFLPHDEFI
jgi:PII-like signaling protein